MSEQDTSNTEVFDQDAPESAAPEATDESATTPAESTEA